MATDTKTKSGTDTRIETTKTRLRRGRHAYIGLYGLAYDRIQLRREQAKALTETLFADLSEKGETTIKQAEVILKQAQKGAWKNYSNVSDKVVEAVPFNVKSRVEVLEDELGQLQATFDRLTKTSAKTKATPKKATVKKTTAKKAPVKKTEAKKVEVKKTVTAEAPAPAVVTPATSATPAPVAATPKADTPRHVPYYLDVKRYDPLASEDIVRKIVNHCGIALRNEDARYVACSDESERVTVRESWLKRKLALTETDKDLDKKVQEVCTLMQRDQKKNRVTFYYLLAKKERLLETL